MVWSLDWPEHVIFSGHFTGWFMYGPYFIKTMNTHLFLTYVQRHLSGEGTCLESIRLAVTPQLHANPTVMAAGLSLEAEE